MTGHEIAEELRNTKYSWTQFRLHRDGSYCVLGIKALEHGATPKQVAAQPVHWACAGGE